MALFNRIPERFFSILVSQKKELYVQALFVLRQAFKTELVIRREDLVVMLMDALEEDFATADFSEEAAEDNNTENADNLTGKAYLLIRKLKDTGWIETEFEAKSFEEHITIPDYAVAVMNLLYDLSTEKIREYNSYVYATHAALANAKDNPDYVYQALQAAWNNTVALVDELKSLFNNIRRYYARIAGEDNVNTMLSEHFDEYKTRIVDAIYYPLKTMDSVPRFKHTIISTLNTWLLEEETQDRIVRQGMMRRVFENEDDGREQMFSMINYIVDTYDGIEEMIGAIDHRHTEYVNASIEHIRYLMNSDRGVRGNLIELLRRSRDVDILKIMEENLTVYRHQFFDDKSLYSEVRRTKKEMGPPLAIMERKEPEEIFRNFLVQVRNQYSDRRIDEYVIKCFGDKDMYSTKDVPIDTTEDFLLFLLSTIRAGEKNAPYTIRFEKGNCTRNGYQLPEAVFMKGKKK